MKNYEKELDFDNAKKGYKKLDNGTFVYKNVIQPFSKFSPAYVLTNEDIRWISGLTQAKGIRVLTVAGSGDQPMFYRMHGAKEIDTFDISFCSKAMIDIKNSAAHKLRYEEYVNLIQDLYKSDDISKIPNIQNILSEIPNDSLTFIQQMKNYLIFANGLNPCEYKNFILTKKEFEQMRSRTSTPFNFIWTDIDNLHLHLTKKYNVINLSNIIEYMTDKDKIYQTLINLRKHLKPNGCIIVQTGLLGVHKKNDMFYELNKDLKNWAKFGKVRKNPKDLNSYTIAFLQRTR